jgi:hypothetical protein
MPSSDFVFYGFSRQPIFFPRPTNNLLAMVVPVAPRRQRPGHEWIAVFAVFQNLDADFVVVQIHKPACRVCLTEFPFKDFRISLAHAEGHD